MNESSKSTREIENYTACCWHVFRLYSHNRSFEFDCRRSRRERKFLNHTMFRTEELTRRVPRVANPWCDRIVVYEIITLLV